MKLGRTGEIYPWLNRFAILILSSTLLSNTCTDPQTLAKSPMLCWGQEGAKREQRVDCTRHCNNGVLCFVLFFKSCSTSM